MGGGEAAVQQRTGFRPSADLNTTQHLLYLVKFYQWSRRWSNRSYGGAQSSGLRTEPGNSELRELEIAADQHTESAINWLLMAPKLSLTVSSHPEPGDKLGRAGLSRQRGYLRF